MGRKSLISEVLASADAKEVEAAAVEKSPAPKASFLTQRLDNLTEAARMVKKPTIKIKPSECSIWAGNARVASLMNYERNQTLIESIKSENGNRIPVVIRKVKNGDKDYELIVGTRRHWSVAWLNANHFPEIELLATIEDLDDEAAFRLADIENREKQDISDLERGLNYKAAVDKYYGGVQRTMAQRLGMSTTTLNRFINLTLIPQKVINAFASPLDIFAHYADALLPLIRSPYHCDQLLKAADSISAEQSFRQAEGMPLFTGPQVLARLKKEAKRSAQPEPTIAISSNGVDIGTVNKNTKNSLVLTINRSNSNADEIIEALKTIIKNSLILSE